MIGKVRPYNIYESKKKQISRMFDNISYNYDITNKIISFGSDRIWRKKLVNRLASLQNEDGSWINENGRWWERDPALVTSYALLALEKIYYSLD